MRLPTLLVTAALFAAAVPAQKQNDVVQKKDGARLRGLEITEFTLTGLKARKGTDAVEIPAHLVMAVEWGDLPEAFVAGRAALERGDHATAVQMFGEALKQTDRALLKIDAEFFQLRAEVGAVGADRGAAATAADHAKAWLGANATHFRLPEAALLHGRALRLAGKGAEAVSTLKELDDRASREGFGAVWSARAKFEQAQALLGDGKTSEARIAFQATSAAADTALSTPSADDAELKNLKVLAKVGEGETFLGEKQYARAESFFKALAGGGQAELVAAGRAGEGEALFLAAAEQKDAAGLRKAQLALATASVLDALSGEASAKANYYLGQCLLLLGADREGDAWKARANGYFQLVVDHYPTSKWAAKAKAAKAP